MINLIVYYYYYYYVASASGIWVNLPLYLSLLNHNPINPFTAYLIDSEDENITTIPEDPITCNENMQLNTFPEGEESNMKLVLTEKGRLFKLTVWRVYNNLNIIFIDERSAK